MLVATVGLLLVGDAIDREFSRSRDLGRGNGGAAQCEGTGQNGCGQGAVDALHKLLLVGFVRYVRGIQPDVNHNSHNFHINHTGFEISLRNMADAFHAKRVACSVG